MAGLIATTGAQHSGSDIWYADIFWEADDTGACGPLVTDVGHAGYLFAIATWPGLVAPRNNSDLILYHTVDSELIDVRLIQVSQGRDLIKASEKYYQRISPQEPMHGYIGFEINGNNVPRAGGGVRLYFRRPLR